MVVKQLLLMHRLAGVLDARVYSDSQGSGGCYAGSSLSIGHNLGSSPTRGNEGEHQTGQTPQHVRDTTLAHQLMWWE